MAVGKEATGGCFQHPSATRHRKRSYICILRLIYSLFCNTTYKKKKNTGENFFNVITLCNNTLLEIRLSLICCRLLSTKNNIRFRWKLYDRSFSFSRLLLLLVYKYLCHVTYLHFTYNLYKC